MNQKPKNRPAMKHILFTILFFALTLSVSAQDEAYRKDVQKMMKLMGIPEQVKHTREYYIMWTTPEKEKEFIEKFDPTMPELLKNTEDYFTTKYTHDEVKAIINFYETSAGKKLTANNKKYIELYNEADDKYQDKFLELNFAQRKNQPKQKEKE